MKRTYRPKKNVPGALDHKDILNVNEKSSIFDAFYIENLKQTKRELSYVSSKQYVIPTKTMRKRKYTKRIVKNANSIIKDLSVQSTFLTPNKSIRVNKAFDPFDALLNSSPNTQTDVESNKNDLFKNVQARREPKSYTRQKKKNKPKRINYSESDTDSEKENLAELSNISHNITDIRKHKLLIEKEPKANNNCDDDSINNIVLSTSKLNKFKKKESKDSLKKFSLIRLTPNNSVQQPTLEYSPLSSTPFKEKYRSQSIYKFSPILKSYDNDANVDAIIEKNNTYHNRKSLSEVYEQGSPDLQKSLNQVCIDNNNFREPSFLSFLNVQEDSRAQVINLDKTEKWHEDEVNNIKPDTFIEVSCLHTTETEIFLGFPSNVNNDFNGTIKENEPNGEKDVQKVDKLDIYKAKCPVMSHNIIDLEHEDINNYEALMQNNGTEVDNINSGSQDSITFSILNTEENENDCLHNERQTLYDTCYSESLYKFNRSVVREPVVRLERMDDSIFFKYQKKILDISQNDDSSNSLTDEDSKEFKYFKNKSKTETIKTENSYSVGSNSEISSTNDVTESSIMDNDEISSSDEPIKSASEEEICANFVTTRKRTKPTSHSVLSDFECIRYSGSMEFEKTVCNISKANTVDSVNKSPDDKMSTLVNITEKQVSSKENSNIKSFNSTSSNESNYYDNDSTDDRSIYIMASDKRFSVKSYLKCANRKHNTRKRSSRISSTRKAVKSEYISEYTEHPNDRENDPYGIEVISSDSAPEKCSSVSYKAMETTSADSENENNEVSLNAIPINVLDSDDTSSCNSGLNTSCITRRKSKRITSKYTKVCGKINNAQLSNTQMSNIKETLNSKEETVQASYRNEPTEDDCNSVNTYEVINIIDSRLPSIESSMMLSKTILAKNSEKSSTSATDIKPTIVLEPGKKWERSLSIYRRMTMMADNLNQSILDEPIQMKGRKYRQSVINTMEMQDFRGSQRNESINSRRSTFVYKPSRSTIKIVKDPNITRASLYTTAVYDDLKGFLSDDCDDTIVDLSKLSIADAEPDVTVLEVQNTSNRLATAKDYVLRRCNQTDAILFDECYPDTVLKNCHKIGEGVYGEVFLWRDRDGRARVMKIVPIAGHVKVNGECQKDFHEIISEIVIAMELSALRAPIADLERHFDEGENFDSLDLHAIENATDVFNEVLAVRCVYGNYPSRLLDLWDLYDECKGSENDNPAILPAEQQYLVLELANAGLDLESYQFNNAEQAHALFLQVAFGLAVGEEAYQFEHRDLHWGNVLIAPTEQKFATFVLRGRGHRVPRCGVAATIIDYSLSRISLPLGVGAECAALYNDLGADEALFDALGDYQFEVYRLMRDKLGNDWKNFEPHTNILWLHYIVDKMITALRYKRTNTKIHKHYIDKLKSIKNRILDYKSTIEFVLTDNEF